MVDTLVLGTSAQCVRVRVPPSVQIVRWRNGRRGKKHWKHSSYRFESCPDYKKGRQRIRFGHKQFQKCEVGSPLTIWSGSSAGQSNSLLSCGPKVRILLGSLRSQVLRFLCSQGKTKWSYSGRLGLSYNNSLGKQRRWQRIWFGTRGSQVRILSSRLPNVGLSSCFYQRPRLDRITLSSNGRTNGFGPFNRSSNLWGVTKLEGG